MENNTDSPQTFFHVFGDVLVAGDTVFVCVVDDHVPNFGPVGHVTAVKQRVGPVDALDQIVKRVMGVRIADGWMMVVGGRSRIRLWGARTGRRYRLLAVRQRPVRRWHGHFWMVPGGLCVFSFPGPVRPAVHADVRDATAAAAIIRLTGHLDYGHLLLQPSGVFVLQVDHEQHGDQHGGHAEADEHAITEFHRRGELWPRWW